MRYFLGAIFLLLTSCTVFNHSKYWPYLNMHPEIVEKKQPRSVDECLVILDDVLHENSREHFKNQDSLIATIEICTDGGIGNFFINCWNLNFFGKTEKAYGVTDAVREKYQQPPNIVKLFNDRGIDDPSAMIRVIFNCYYKKLNNLTYNWEDEIIKINKYWVNPERTGYYVNSSREMKLRDSRILNDFYFENIDIEDTVACLYNRPPRLFSKEPDWYYVTGIVVSKNYESKTLDAKLININSEFDKDFMLTESDVIFIGDTISEYARNWHSEKLRYFSYRFNEYNR